jgi:EAL domain-containing protein (putative c-di-GMP-specific phosphodiesterase class I)
LRNRHLLAAIRAALRQSGLAPMRLELEITETALLQDSETTLDALHRLRDLGVQITLDDFGTGHSSLSYLRQFPFDRLKIDRTFTRELGRQADCGAIVRAVAGLGGELGMAVTGEWVETSQQLDTLTRAGCNEVQGYLFSPAVPPEEVLDVIGSMTIPGGAGAAAVNEYQSAVA